MQNANRSAKQHLLGKNNIALLKVRFYPSFHNVQHCDMYPPTYVIIFSNTTTSCNTALIISCTLMQKNLKEFLTNLVASRHFLTKRSRLTFESRRFHATTVFEWSFFTKQRGNESTLSELEESNEHDVSHKTRRISWPLSCDRFLI